jgi:hypothetical protein
MCLWFMKVKILYSQAPYILTYRGHCFWIWGRRFNRWAPVYKTKIPANLKLLHSSPSISLIFYCDLWRTYNILTLCRLYIHTHTHTQYVRITLYFHDETSPGGPGPPHYRGFTTTPRHTALGWQHAIITKRQTSMPPAWFGPAIPEIERPQAARPLGSRITFPYCKFKHDSWLIESKPVKVCYCRLLWSCWKQRPTNSIHNEIQARTRTELRHFSPMERCFISRFHDLTDSQIAERRTHTHTQVYRIIKSWRGIFWKFTLTVTMAKGCL